MYFCHLIYSKLNKNVFRLKVFEGKLDEQG